VGRDKMKTIPQNVLILLGCVILALSYGGFAAAEQPPIIIKQVEMSSYLKSDPTTTCSGLEYISGPSTQWLELRNVLDSDIQINGFTIKVENEQNRTLFQDGPDLSNTIRMKSGQSCTYSFHCAFMLSSDQRCIQDTKNVIFTFEYNYGGKPYADGDFLYSDGGVVYKALTPPLTDQFNDAKTWQFKNKKWIFENMQAKTISPPLTQFNSGIPINQIQCKEGFVVAIKASNNSPVCVKQETMQKLRERGWAEPLGSVAFQRPSQDIRELSEKSDRIIAGMVTDKEKIGNSTEVWIGIYEWLKKSPNYNSIILDIQQDSPESELNFQKGEEMLLFLRDINPANGHFGIFYLDGKTKPTKYPLEMKQYVAQSVKPEDKEPYYMYQENENCKNLAWENDSFLYCTYPEEEFRYYIPILETVDRVKQKMLPRVSEKYFAEHFDLRRAYDTAVTNGHTIPTGQDLEFDYKLGNQSFLYLVHVFGDDKEAYIVYSPPKEIQSLVDESTITEMIQSCVGKETYPLIWDKAMVSRDEKGFTPVITGGTPSIYDRYGKAVLHPTKQQFRVWPETGEIECSKGTRDFESSPIQPQKRELLIDSTEFLKIKK
jgi:hypothetical protein